MIEWKKTGKIVSNEGTTITYSSGTAYTIESRKRHIPHAGGRSGTWNHTTYFILKDGSEVAEKYFLSDAKYLAETMIEEETENEHSL